MYLKLRSKSKIELIIRLIKLLLHEVGMILSVLWRNRVSIFYVILLSELLLAHYVIFSFIYTIKTTSDIEDLSFIRKTVQFFKNGGLLFVQEQVVDRLVFHEGRLLADVSDSGEFAFIYHRIREKYSDLFNEDGEEDSKMKLIIDIGANDGLLSSNSFNFIQLGWDAILVDPVMEQLELAKKNLKRYNNPWNEDDSTSQRVYFSNYAIGLEDKEEIEIVVAQDFAQMETSIVADKQIETQRWIKRGYKPNTIHVEQLSIQSFTKKYKIPNRFGVLSIDAEGLSTLLIEKFIELGFRPQFIIFETTIHEGQTEDTILFLKSKKYRFISHQRHWNTIAEYIGN